MKRFATGLPKPCSFPMRGFRRIEDAVNGNTFPPRPTYQAQFSGTRHNVRHSSSKSSRPRTALFFPGTVLSLHVYIEFGLGSVASADNNQARESRE